MEGISVRGFKLAYSVLTCVHETFLAKPVLTGFFFACKKNYFMSIL